MKIQLNGYYGGNPPNVVLDMDEATAIAMVKQGGARLPDEDAPPVSKVEAPVEEEPPAEEKPQDINIDDLEINESRKNALFLAGLNTARDVLAYCETEELTALDGIGPESAKLILAQCRDSICMT